MTIGSTRARLMVAASAAILIAFPISADGASDWNAGKDALYRSSECVPCMEKALRRMDLDDREIDQFIIGENDSKTLLQAAAEKGFAETVSLLLDRGADPNLKSVETQFGYQSLPAANALYWGVDGGDLEAVTRLIEAGADVNALTSHGTTALHAAIEPFSSISPLASPDEEKLAILKVLLNNGADFDLYASPSSRSPLQLAVSSQAIPALEVLISKGASFDADGLISKDLVRLGRVAGNPVVAELIRATLLQEGVDANQAESNNATILHHLAAAANRPGDWRGEAAERRTELLVRLLKAGADPNRKAAGQSTPLHWFITNPEGTPEFLDALLAGGALPDEGLDPQLSYWQPVDIPPGATPLYIAAANGHGWQVDALARAGANVSRAYDFKDTQNWRAIHVAALQGTRGVVDALLANGAKADARLADGRVALHFAAAKGRAEVVASLLQGGADIDLADNSGATPLAFAAMYKSANWRGVANALIAAGADPNVRLASGDTLLHYAVRKNNTELASILIDAGAHASVPGADGKTARQLIAARIAEERRLAEAKAEEERRKRLAEAREAEERRETIGALAGIAAGAVTAGVLADSGLDAETTAEFALEAGRGVFSAATGDTAGHRQAMSRLESLNAKLARRAGAVPSGAGSREGNPSGGGIGGYFDTTLPGGSRGGAGYSPEALGEVSGDLGAFGAFASSQPDRGALTATDGSVNAEGYRHFKYDFTCPTGSEHSIAVPYKSESGLRLTKQYTRAVSCNLTAEMNRLAKQCRTMGRPHCIER